MSDRSRQAHQLEPLVRTSCIRHRQSSMELYSKKLKIRRPFDNWLHMSDKSSGCSGSNRSLATDLKTPC